MAETLPADIEEFISGLKGPEAKAIQQKYGIKAQTLPEKFEFKWFLHDDSENYKELARWILKGALKREPKLVEINEFVEKYAEVLRYAFYEVTLKCEFDSRSGDIKILEAH